MNVHIPMPDAVRVIVTDDGQVVLPEAMLDQAGLAPGRSAMVVVNDRGEVVLRAETPDEHAARIGRAIQELGARYATGQTTEEYMAIMRGTDDHTP